MEVEEKEKSKGGRPRGFDRDKAVDIAMRLFWRHGYEGVSIAELTKAIGIAAPSLYAAFGSKEELFAAALARYEQDSAAFDLSKLRGAKSLSQAVRLLLEASIDAVTSPKRERGCMISSGLIACHPDHQALADDLGRRRDAMRKAIGAALRPWVDEKEAQRIARHLAAVMQGISIQARDGASSVELREIVDEVVAGLATRPAAAVSARHRASRSRSN
ncbi:transcriptional regulator, TetR family [Enhydrobacter aerosaccus]|uniref:Transcriptional regulator, TetR family n=2 Tax=Enhydrobacter aerosaccus TaxID=225324 RepID=A0A1T4RLS2_9HYPH|nr:transcriptional regulator, TetR family [Enhydrobacter aerosaccus]